MSAKRENVHQLFQRDLLFLQLLLFLLFPFLLLLRLLGRIIFATHLELGHLDSDLLPPNIHSIQDIEGQLNGFSLQIKIN